jgi:hypothetical protein
MLYEADDFQCSFRNCAFDERNHVNSRMPTPPDVLSEAGSRSTYRDDARARMTLTNRRFPPPWSLEQQDACFVVRDGNGQQLAYVYFEDEPGRRLAKGKAAELAALKLVRNKLEEHVRKSCPLMSIKIAARSREQEETRTRTLQPV